MIDILRLISNAKRYAELQFEKNKLFEMRCNSEAQLKSNYEKIESINLSLKMLCE
jgi:hypothetical protein